MAVEGECWQAFSASWVTAWVSRWASATTVARAARLEDPAARAQDGGLAEHVLRPLVEVERTEVEEVGPLGPGQGEQVLDHPVHPVDLVGDERRRGRPLLRVVLEVEELEVPPDHGERRPQLVAGLVEEAPLVGERRLQPADHVVEGHGDLRGLVPAPHRDALGQARLGDGERGVGELAQRPEHPPGQGVPDQGRHDDRGRQDERLGRDGVVDLGTFGAGEVGGDEVPLPLPRRDRAARCS